MTAVNASVQHAGDPAGGGPVPRPRACKFHGCTGDRDALESFDEGEKALLQSSFPRGVDQLCGIADSLRGTRPGVGLVLEVEVPDRCLLTMPVEASPAGEREIGPVITAIRRWPSSSSHGGSCEIFGTIPEIFDSIRAQAIGRTSPIHRTVPAEVWPMTSRKCGMTRRSSPQPTPGEHPHRHPGAKQLPISERVSKRNRRYLQ
jgi:hypothetical protein